MERIACSVRADDDVFVLHFEDVQKVIAAGLHRLPQSQVTHRSEDPPDLQSHARPYQLLTTRSKERLRPSLAPKKWGRLEWIIEGETLPSDQFVLRQQLLPQNDTSFGSSHGVRPGPDDHWDPAHQLLQYPQTIAQGYIRDTASDLFVVDEEGLPPHSEPVDPD